jgi:hypothetical protein
LEPSHIRHAFRHTLSLTPIASIYKIPHFSADVKKRDKKCKKMQITYNSLLEREKGDGVPQERKRGMSNMTLLVFAPQG